MTPSDIEASKEGDKLETGRKWESSVERESLISYCDAVIAPKLAAAEKQRLDLKPQRYRRLGIGTVLYVMVVFIIAKSTDNTVIIINALFLGVLILLYGLIRPPYKLVKMMKADIIPDMLSQLNWSYEEGFEKSTDFYHLNRNDVFPKWHSKHYRDKITGKIAGIPFTAFEIHMSHGGGDSEVNYDFFMIKVPAEKRFSGVTLIKTKRHKLDLNQRWVKALSRVKFVSSKFESLFDVYTSDNIEAQYLLPPNDIETITAFKETLEGKKPNNWQVSLGDTAEELSQIFNTDSINQARTTLDSMTFMQGHLYIVLGGSDFFEFKTKLQNFNDPEPIHKTLREIDLIHNIFDHFKSWMKPT